MPPVPSLGADAQRPERFIKRYRTPRGSNKTTPISATRSKAILEALAATDWTKIDPELRQSPQDLFVQLGVGAKDGFQQPADFQQFPAAAKKWLKDNAATYRIQSYVADDDPSK